jgi:Cu(I)/Ag(I) efflux system membrane fusion protein
MRVMPDTTLFVVADLARVWVVGSVFEGDLGSVEVGDRAQVSFAGGAAPDRDATVSFIAPTLDETTRTAKLRIELDNRDGLVRPGLFAEITLSIEGGSRLAVPVAAVIDTGRRSVAFVETSPGRFEPRDIRVGGRAGDWIEVREGLQAGERVATRALFLLDAESQIRGGPAGPAHGGH